MYSDAEFPALKSQCTVHILQDLIGDYFQFLTQEYSYDNRVLEDKTRIILDIIRIELCKLHATIKNAICLSLLDTMFSSIAYVRDIHNGLGLRDATYALLHVWYDFYPMLAITAFKHLLLGDYYQYGYGSWRDICGLCDYIRTNSKRGLDHPLIDNAVQIMNKQLHDDWLSYENNGICSTNCAKWVPREKSKHGWLFDKLVLQWIDTHSPNILQSNQWVAALSGCKRRYRKMISAMTTFISPMEIHMCAKKHTNILLDQLHHHALAQNWDLLFNQTASLDILHNQPDRQNCCNQLSTSMKQDTHCSIGYKSPLWRNHSTIHFPEYIGKYIQRAIRCIRQIETFSDKPSFSSRLSDEINILNKKWAKISYLWSKTHCIKEHDLAIICYNSVSMQDPILHYVIAQACLISEWSGVKRILYSAHNPIWIDLDICDGFIAKVRAIYYAIQYETLVCSTRDSAHTFLGPDHPFSALFITEHGWCTRKDDQDESPYYQLWSILDQPRYKNIHDCFARVVGENE